MAEPIEAPAPRRRGRPPAQRSEDTLARILRAARAGFSRSGYARTSMADIAREAGVTSRAIYHYVDSKPELFALAAQAAYRRFGAETVERVFRHADTRSRLRGYIDVFRSLYKDDPTMVAFISLATLEADRTPELRDRLPANLGCDPTQLIVESVARGELAPGVDPAGAVALLEVFGAGLALVANGDRGPEYLAMLDALEHLLDGSLLAEQAPEP
jgi:AcrR family transcriptional regulator